MPDREWDIVDALTIATLDLSRACEARNKAAMELSAARRDAIAAAVRELIERGSAVRKACDNAYDLEGFCRVDCAYDWNEDQPRHTADCVVALFDAAEARCAELCK